MADMNEEEFNKMFGGIPKDLIRKAFGDRDASTINTDDLIAFARKSMEEADKEGPGMAVIADVQRGRMLFVFPKAIDSLAIDVSDIPLVLPVIMGAAKHVIEGQVFQHLANMSPAEMSDFISLLRDSNQQKREEENDGGMESK